MEKRGKIKISSENIMPIIKKWLYSDKDILLREIVANGVDAVTKHKKLVDMGEAIKTDEEYAIRVFVDEKAKTLTVEDNGLGMTWDEVEKYITQIAFSGAADFLDKYENASGDGIIGHFGLGFYSAYMVSNKVEIFTKSYKDEPAVYWESDGNSTYKIGETESEGVKTFTYLFLPDEENRSIFEISCTYHSTTKDNSGSYTPYERMELEIRVSGNEYEIKDEHRFYYDGGRWLGYNPALREE
jgi:molecular chaperone HtpG